MSMDVHQGRSYAPPLRNDASFGILPEEAIHLDKLKTCRKRGFEKRASES